MGWMRPLVALVAAMEKYVDRAVCVAGAVLCAQLPEFMQQYLQRLGGHLDEARRILGGFMRVARESGLGLPAYIARLTANPDPVVVRTGEEIRALVARVNELTAAENALREASAWSRVFVFLGRLDTDIATETWRVFRPAVPTTFEGLVYATVGIGLGLTLYHLTVKWPLQRWHRSSQRPTPPSR